MSKKKAEWLCEFIMEQVAENCRPIKGLPCKAIKPRHSCAEDVVMHISDEHMDEVVLPEQVGGTEEYNFEVALARAENYVTTVLEQSRCFDKLHIFCYGDHTTGEIHNLSDYTEERNQIRSVLKIGQVHALMFRDLAAAFNSVDVTYVPGNHGRRGPEKNYNKPQDNWDYLIGQIAKMQTPDIENLTIATPNSYQCVIPVRNMMFSIQHGDDVKIHQNIPYNGIRNRSHRQAANNKIDCHVYGHFHHPSMLPYGGDTEIIINGSWKATDAYAYNKFNSSTEPSQWLHGVDDSGITWRYKVKLRQGVDTPIRYSCLLRDQGYHAKSSS